MATEPVHPARSSSHSLPLPHQPLRGYRGVRAALLDRLKREPGQTAAALAEATGASVNAVRQHLKALGEDGVVTHARERHGVGAPLFRYRLSPAGEALFPRAYDAAFLAALDQVVSRRGRPAAAELLAAPFDELERELLPDLTVMEAAGRLERVASAQDARGYMAEWRRSGDDARLTQHNCAIHAVAVRYPEVCDAESRFLTRVLGAPVERRSHILSGCSQCEYVVALPERGSTSTAGWDVTGSDEETV